MIWQNWAKNLSYMGVADNDPYDSISCVLWNVDLGLISVDKNCGKVLVGKTVYSMSTLSLCECVF